ncbi:unnamed protein product [Spirodela intermedia]|uniref:Arf-GAP domain-containing protein n=1 Tax=Spirodela intermedia TaxID=51605 RepID=A0A7I8IUK8_SPIIN|nr:unnamed protein product [Spirodela intermedia]CAA6660843.1 unnamed protein product [Spirodela intermedia]
MASRVKEDEKNEKIIRGLLKLPANRRCINCNSLGPQYVCTNFWTFICMNCSGIHREFTHRVKSVSMAKFTTQEVNALQEGGNERAKEIYFKQWDPQRHSFPDSSNVDRLRDFIKHVYVERRYTGERSVDGPSRVKGEREDSYENKKSDAHRGGSRSPPFEDKYDRRNMERLGSGGRNDDRNFRSSYEERRSPGYDRSDYRRSPGRFDAVDERRQDDRHGNGNQIRSFEDRRFPDGLPRPEGRPANHQKESKVPSPPMVRPVREILGEDVPPLRVGEPPKTDGTKAVNGSLQTQADLLSVFIFCVEKEESRLSNSLSSTGIEGAVADGGRTTSSNSLASIDSNPAEVKRPDLGSLIDFDANPEPAVAPSSQPVPKPTTDSQVNGGNWASFYSVPQPKPPQPASNLSPLESALSELSIPPAPAVNTVSSLPSAGVDPFSLANDAAQVPAIQQNQPSLFPPNLGQPSVLHASLFAPSPRLDLTTPAGTGIAGTSQPSAVDGKNSGRRELPAAMPSFPQPPKSTNPFDFSNEAMMPHAHSTQPARTCCFWRSRHEPAASGRAPADGHSWFPFCRRESLRIETSSLRISYPLRHRGQCPILVSFFPKEKAGAREIIETVHCSKDKKKMQRYCCCVESCSEEEEEEGWRLFKAMMGGRGMLLCKQKAERSRVGGQRGGLPV